VTTVFRAIAIVCAAPVLAGVLAAQTPGARPSDDPASQARLALQRGQALLHDNHVPQARDAGIEALKLYEQLNNSWGIGAASQLLGEATSRMGDVAQAKAHYERALGAFDAIDDRGGRARTLLGLVVVAKLPINEETALLERAARDARSAADRALEGQIVHSLADHFFNNGLYEPALDKLEQAAALFEAAGQQVDLGSVYNSLGRLYRVHGRIDIALQYQLKALAIHEKAGDPYFHLQSLNAVAVSYQRIGDLTRARDYLERAMAMANDTGSPRFQDFIGANLAGVLYDQGEYQRAAQLLEQTLARDADVFPSQRYDALAFTYLKLGRNEEALSTASKAFDLCGRKDDECIWALNTRAWAHSALGHDDAAIADIRSALDRLEAVRARLVPGDFLKQQFNSRREEIYSHAVVLQMRQHHTREAFETAELARSRAFVDLLAGNDLAVKDAVADAPLVFRGGSENGGASRARPIAPRGLQSTVAAPAATVDDLAATAARLRSTIVTYWVADDSVSIWVIKADGSCHAAQVEVRRARLAELIQATTPSAGEPDRTSAAERRVPTRGSLGVALQSSQPAVWRELYDLLIRPVRSALPKSAGSLITIVPHGPLGALSFAALQDERGRYLLEDYALHYVPAGAVLQFTAGKIKSSARTGRVMLVADPTLSVQSRLDQPLPPLPGARAEVRAISSLIPAARVTVLEGSRASESNVRESSNGKTVLHFASHAIVKDDDPFGSYLALGRTASRTTTDGHLTAQEIYGLNISADLVVLSACRSGGGRVTGDGIATLARAFIYAGAPSLVTSLWDVADEPTNQLLPAFYRSWLAGASKARALRAAQLRVLRDLRAGKMQIATPLGPVFLPEHPVFWAGFALVGEPN